MVPFKTEGSFWVHAGFRDVALGFWAAGLWTLDSSGRAIKIWDAKVFAMPHPSSRP